MTTSTNTAANPADRFTEQEIIAVMARQLFLHAFVEYMDENHGETYSEEKLEKVLPPITDAAAYHAAATLVHDLVRANGMVRLARLWERCEDDTQPDYEIWASRVASQYIGTGIAWDDNGGDPDADFTVPYGEFGSHSLQTDYDAAGDAIAVD